MPEYRTIRYRLHPQSKEKRNALAAQAGACRAFCNHCLNACRQGHDTSFFSLGKPAKPWRRDPDHLWRLLYSANITRGAAAHIAKAYKLHRKAPHRYAEPKFKAKYGADPWFPLPEKKLFKVVGGSLWIQKLGWFKITGSNPYPEAAAVSGTIKRESGKWYAYLAHAVEADVRPVELPAHAVGIDRNTGNVATSEGELIAMPDMTRKEKKIKKCQRRLDRKDRMNARLGRAKHSNRREKMKRRLGLSHKDVVNERVDWCHKVSRYIADRFDVAFLEDLPAKDMTKSAKGTIEKPGKHVAQKRGLNRRIQGAQWYRFEQMLGYKTNVMKVDGRNTSRKCHCCGHIDKENRKTQSDFKCVSCGHTDNADLNAALNILAAGTAADVSDLCRYDVRTERQRSKSHNTLPRIDSDAPLGANCI